MNRTLFLNLGLTLLGGAVLLWIIKITPTIHYAYLPAAALAVGLGFLEPHRGWILALALAAFLWIGYQFTPPPDGSADREVENFGVYGSMIIGFIGSFIGGILKRALDGK
jgi:uncharacterized membrane protein YjjB (DUF3815 family)